MKIIVGIFLFFCVLNIAMYSMSIIYSVIFVLFPKYIFLSMGADNDVLEGAIDFSQIAFGGAVFTWLLYILSAV